MNDWKMLQYLLYRSLARLLSLDFKSVVVDDLLNFSKTVLDLALGIGTYLSASFTAIIAIFQVTFSPDKILYSCHAHVFIGKISAL